LFAQRKFGAPQSDNWCASDVQVVHRVIDALAGGDRERAMEFRRRVEQKAAIFVDRHWSSITALSKEITARGRLDEDQIRRILRADTTSARSYRYGDDETIFYRPGYLKPFRRT
jgi:hypothetical protein